MSANRKISPGQWVLEFFTALLLAFLWVINLLPFRAKISLGLGLGHLLYLIPGSRVSIARTNIDLCFPDLPRKEREDMVRDTFRNFGAGLVETVMCWWDNPRSIHPITETVGLEHLEAARSKGRGVILLGAHFSTLDISAMLVAKHFPMYAIYREQKNRVLNHFMVKGREKYLLGSIPHTSMMGAARRLKEGNPLWYSADQDMGEDRSVYAPFFGHPAATIHGISRLAKLTGAPLLMMATRRRSDNSGYVVEYLPAPDEFPLDDDVANATIINEMIERGIRSAPAQYYWFHRRFKTQPGMEKGALYRRSSLESGIGLNSLQ